MDPAEFVRLAVDREALRRVAEALPRAAPADPELVEGGWSVAESEVLARFFSGRRLVSIPSQHHKRLLVLERLAQEFEPGVHYSEAEVNSTLQQFHPDNATLRRYLVDSTLLSREAGVYWRSGGRFPDAGPGPGGAG